MKVSATNGTVLTARNSRRLSIKKYWQENWQYYILLLPAIIFTVVFAYVPM